MKMQKGICVKMNNGRSIFLLEDGRFLEGRAVNATEVGEEGYFVPAARSFHMHWAKVIAPAAALVAALLLVLSTMLPSEEAYAYIQLEANPGIELGIDEDIKVISIRHLNNDGKRMIGKLGDWKGHSLDEILSRSIALAANSATGEVTITTVAGESGESAKGPVEQTVLAVAVAAVKNNVDIHLKKATHMQWKKSVKENVPVGQKVEKFTPLVREEDGGTLKTKGSVNMDGQVHAENKKVKIPPGQEKKADSDLKANNEAVPPGQQKKADPKVKANPANPQKQEKKAAPPAHGKKAQPPGQEKKSVPKNKAQKAAPKAEVKKAPPQAKEKKAAPPAQKEKAKKPPKENKVKPTEKPKKSPSQGAEKNKKTPEQKEKISNSQKKNSTSKKGQK